MQYQTELSPARLTQIPETPGIPPQYQDMWRKLLLLKIDEPDMPLSFCKKLAAEKGWSEEYAERVLGEYKRFLLLCRAFKTMTPSNIVDQAWHLHLQYSEQYWEELCPLILGTKIHHRPGNGGEGETEIYQERFRFTLKAYTSFFGEPPEDIWGKLEEAPEPAQTQS